MTSGTEHNALLDRIGALEAALVDAVDELDSYGDEMPFTDAGKEAHKALIAKFRKVIKGDGEECASTQGSGGQ